MLDVDQLQQSKNTLIALGMAMRAILGTSTLFDGLACTSTGPASLQVLVGPGSVYALENVDSTAYGSLASDTAHQIVKQGINLGTLTLNCPAPGTTGQSINYLIQSAYQDTDTGATVLPYFDSTNPDVAYNGPNNTGVSQNTVREGQCLVAVKAGVAATTGTQVTPAPDAGYTGLWVVTVAHGQTMITSGNISLAPSAPFISEKLGDKISIPTGDARYLMIGTGLRTRLTTNATYYVATTGNDSNPGTSGSPWLTLQHALNFLQSSIDTAGFAVTINNADGTYSGNTLVTGDFVGGGPINIIGNTSVPANCILSSSSADALKFVNCRGTQITIDGFKITTATSGIGISAYQSDIIVGQHMNFGSCASTHMSAYTGANIVLSSLAYTISGGGTSHWFADNGSRIVNVGGGATMTLTGTPAFSNGFANSNDNSTINPGSGITFSGSATGQYFIATSNGVVQTNGSGATYLPGNAGGSTSTGGQYV